MTQVTPPGWYPDPGQTSDGPATERWWDGKAWTEQTRPAGSATVWGPPAHSPAAGPYPAHPAHPAYPAHPPAPPRRGLRTGIAVAVAAAVLASIGVGVYALSGNGGGDRAGSRQGSGGPGGPGGPGGQGGSEGQGGPFGGPGGGSGGGPGGGSDGGSGGGPGGQSPSPGESGAPKVKGGGTISDPFNGISMRVPDGWTGETLSGGVQVTSDDSYKCPGDTSKSCTAGGAYSAPALLLRSEGDTAEEVAKADIAANAKQSYGGTTYGSITSHKVLASKAVTVAGQKGYLVRWQAVTSKGADGYVESLAFPSPADPRQIVVVRFGVDVGQKASVIDEITKSIKVSSGGGNGQNV
ncbi:DUF2510 domain-containing protein [Streptomyces sp. NPDC004542]|uniref:DUF2510 domain-containing protein n=1 Tax=Streptomyces sp. NPDC004542 TaxID=3154281 RepID=UPI0033A1781B